MSSVNRIVTEWDPLENQRTSDAQFYSSAKRREIKNILKSYVSNYDPFCELIQNAMDAIERRIETDDKFSPSVSVIIDLAENSVEVVDNGCGFTEEEFRSFLAPSVSFKTAGKTRGNKGVGVTYLAYGFNELFIKTKNKNFSFSGIIQGGRDWIEAINGSDANPLMRESTEKSAAFDAIDQGSSFKIVFSGTHIRPSDLSWYQAKNAEQWQYLLQVKTPIGYVSLPGCTESKIKFSVEVIDKSKTITREKDLSAVYRYPHNDISASQRLKSIVDAQLKAISAHKDPSRAIDRFRQSNGLYEVYSTEKLLEMSKWSTENQELMRKYSITAYGYFAHSTDIWDVLNDKKAKLRKGLRVLKGGLQLANNGMIQGDLILIPLTKNIGHQNQAHILVHFEGADPDLGRKGFQPELRELAEQISVNIVQQLSSRRQEILKSDSGAQINIEKEIKVHEWLKSLEDHEKNSPLILLNDKFFLPTKKISITSSPQTEQDVIVLFNQLIAGGVIRGVRLLSTSQVALYDGVFRYFAEEPLSDFEFDKDLNPLGVSAEQLGKQYQSVPKIVEYKFSMDALMRDFESGLKNESEVTLAVFWEMGTEYPKSYSVTSYLDLNQVHKRAHHGLTHHLRSANSGFDVICLKELVEFLNDPDEAQSYQQVTYGSDV